MSELVHPKRPTDDVVDVDLPRAPNRRARQEDDRNIGETARSALTRRSVSMSWVAASRTKHAPPRLRHHALGAIRRAGKSSSPRRSRRISDHEHVPGQRTLDLVEWRPDRVHAASECLANAVRIRLRRLRVESGSPPAGSVAAMRVRSSAIVSRMLSPGSPEQLRADLLFEHRDQDGSTSIDTA